MMGLTPVVAATAPALPPCLLLHPKPSGNRARVPMGLCVRRTPKVNRCLAKKKKTIEEIVQSEPTGPDPGGEMGRLAPNKHEEVNNDFHQEGYTERTQREVEEHEVDLQEMGSAAVRKEPLIPLDPRKSHGSIDGDAPGAGDGMQVRENFEYANKHLKKV